MQKDQLEKLFFEMRDDMNLKWNRVLPFGELINDRWEKANYLGFGKGTNIYDSSIVMGDVRVGTDTWIGPFTLLDGTGGTLEIGNYCSVGAGSHIYTHDTVENCLSNGAIKKAVAPTKIGNNCHISPKVMILKGVKIGDFCVIGTNSFVNKSFEAYSIIAGTPARKIGRVRISEKGEVDFIYGPKTVSSVNTSSNENKIIKFAKSLFANFIT